MDKDISTYQLSVSLIVFYILQHSWDAIYGLISTAMRHIDVLADPEDVARSKAQLWN